MAESHHVALFPFMTQGHFIPFLSLGNLLSSQGLTITFVTTTVNASALQSQAVGSDIRFVSLSLPYIEGLPPGCESTDALSPAECLLFFSASHKLSVPFEQWLEKFIAETSQKPVCIIRDVFLAWSTASASRFGIPLVVFHTTGAMGSSLLQYLFTNPVNEIISDREIIDICDGSLDVNLRRAELPQMLRRECFFSPYPFLSVLQQVYAAAKGSCAATLVNTLDGVEAGYVRYLVESTGKPVWPIAHPLQKPQQGVQSECMRWLDGEKQNSVLNVSFGSSTFLTEDQIKALARSIEASKQPFV